MHDHGQGDDLAARQLRRPGTETTEGRTIMNETTTAVYRMNPAEDNIVFGGELEEDMWVLPESPTARGDAEGTEDELIRAQRFRRVTRLAITHLQGSTQTRCVGEWVDGYQEVHTCHIRTAWLVKKNPPGQETS
jgi:hypothetical protein